MKRFLILFALLCGTFLTAQVQVNESASEFTFLFLDDDVDGTISDFQFTGNIDSAQFENSVLKGTVLMETLDTENWLRNRHLRSKKYFNAKEHPRMSFESTTISPGEQLGQYTVTGKLTIKGITQTVEMDVMNRGNVLVGSTTIFTSDFDINIHKKKERNEVEIKFRIPYSSN